MLTQRDRLTIYCLLGLITFCTIVLRSPQDLNIFALGGLIAAAIGLRFELADSDIEEEEEEW